MSTQLMVYLLGAATAVVGLLLRCLMQRRRPATEDAIGIGVAAAGVSSSVDLVHFAIVSEGTTGTARCISLCIYAVVVFFLAINKTADIFTKSVTPRRKQP